MNPQLLYVYVSDIGRCFHRQGFHFTNDFTVRYRNEDGKLLIEPVENNPYQGLWGDNIDNINLIVGKNGAGKTTLLDLLGSTKTRRLRMFKKVGAEPEKEGNGWFAVYHIVDNLFVVEGYNPALITNIGNEQPGISYEYSVSIQYNYEESTGRHHEYIQECVYTAEGKRYSLDRSLYTLYLTNGNRREWFRGNDLPNESDHYVGFKRNYLNQPSYANLFRFMNHEHANMEAEFTAEHSLCRITLEDNVFEPFTIREEREEELDLDLYQDKGKIVYFNSLGLDQEWTRKEMYIIGYLELLVMDTWLKQCKFVFTEEELEQCRSDVREAEYTSDTLKHRIEYLLVVLGRLQGVLDDRYEPEWSGYDITAIHGLVQAMERLSDRYFLSWNQISVALQGGEITNIMEVLEFIDNNHSTLFGTYETLRVSFGHLSAGELEFVNGFANLYTAMQVATHNKEIGTILLLLDEPDASFHPEWSRRYIHNLTTFLSRIEYDRGLKFQVILTTHSPFIVSDVPKEHITCIKVVKGEDGVFSRVPAQASFGFMSNFYDIIQDDFFITSPIGEHAKKKFSTVVERIHALRYYDREEINRLYGIIAAIGEEVIRKKLYKQLREAERRIIPARERDSKIQELQQQLEYWQRGQAEERDD